MKIAYLLPCYFGNRRCQDDRYEEDCFFYARKHLKQLLRLRSNIDTYILSISTDGKAYTKFANDMVALYQENNKKLIVRHRLNLGMSYGALADIFNEFNKQFDYYIFIEDDYYPIIDDYDKILLSYFDHENVGYVFSLFRKQPELNLPFHAAISNGMFSYKCLESISPIDYPKSKEYIEAEINGQLKISIDILDKQFIIKDFLDKYRSVFRGHDGNFRFYGSMKNPLLIDFI